VDINLEDAWLESLNALEAFDLRSICEGHPPGTEAQGGPHPHIHLRRKESLPPITIRDFDYHSKEILSRLDELFGDGRSNFEVEFRVRMGPAGATRSELWVKIRALHQRVSGLMDEETREWFDTLVERVDSLDSHLQRILCTC
jgi:hypothetical protein